MSAATPDPLLADSNDIIEAQLTTRQNAIGDVLEADVITYVGPISPGAHYMLKEITEATNPKRDKLAVLLETSGGYVESAERIANTLRHHYPVVDFVVTSFAMSAGTILVMSGDAIFMDYSSTLGPIDPQVENASGAWVPALGYLEQYDRLIGKSAAGTLTTAELAYLIQNFDPAELYQYEQARDLSIALLREWLVKYKFKNWKVTETRGLTVTDAMRKLRARQIAKDLNNTKKWHSHSRGISMEVLRRDLRLQIDDVADTPTLQGAVSTYYVLLSDYRMRRGHEVVSAHWKGGYIGL